MSDPHPNRLLARWGPVTAIAVAVLVVVGLLVRIVPLLEDADMLFRQPTEDGYLLLTVARNLALGRGMSTAEGTIPTNGVQPLITLLFSAGYYVVGGDKLEGVRIAMWLSVLIAVFGAAMIYVFGRRVLGGTASAERAAAVAAALWFAAPVSLKHTANALETGLYTAVVVVVLHYLFGLRQRPSSNVSARELAILGVWLGVCFWARNDAVFLSAAVCAVWLWASWREGAIRRGLGQAATIGCTAAVVALPWVLFNVIYFGHPVPVSGRSEGADAQFAGNLDILGAKLAEYISIVGGIPASFEDTAVVQVGSWLMVGLAVACVVRMYRVSAPPVRELILVAALFALALAGYYGLIFGAKHFLSRYQAPTGPIWALFSVVVVREIFAHLSLTSQRVGLAKLGQGVVLGAAVALVVAQDVRLLLHRHEHDHMQVVYWLQEHVDPRVWVGAVQTGTIGYFHERSLNLDGKVNPAALEARRLRRIPDYVMESPVDYLADWWGVARWEPKLQGKFRVVVEDQERNLGVLERVEKRWSPPDVTTPASP